MKVAIIQPNFIPWRGYFDFIRSVDLFILLDDVQFTRRDWRTRNLIKTPSGPRWLSVPVQYASRGSRIDETKIDNGWNWRQNHVKNWRANYARTEYLSDVLEILGDLEFKQDESIADLDTRLIGRICGYLGITTPIVRARDFAVSSHKNVRLIDLLLKVGATIYVSGPSAETYLEPRLFHDAGIGLEYKVYDYAPYPQQWGLFDGAMSVLDLIANCGPHARGYLASKTSNRTVLPPAVSRKAMNF